MASETPMVELLHRLNVMQDRTPEQEAELGVMPDGVVAVFLLDVLNALEAAYERARYLTAPDVAEDE